MPSLRTLLARGMASLANKDTFIQFFQSLNLILNAELELNNRIMQTINHIASMPHPLSEFVPELFYINLFLNKVMIMYDAT